MAPPPFDPKSYYRFSNPAHPNTAISTGYKYENTPPHLGLTSYGSRSSENWQIYRQRDASGRSVYFIRNYDYGADLQLGLTEEARAVPRLLPRSGDLGQQWSMRRDGEGSWVLMNGLLGNGSFLGVSEGGNSGRYTREVPSMQPSPDGSEKWVVTINVSAGQITQKEALEDVKSVQIPISSTTSSLLPFQTPTSTSLPTAHPSIAPVYESVANLMGELPVLLFLPIFLCVAMLSCCKRQRSHGKKPACAVESEENDGNGLPVYEEKEQVENCARESSQ